MPLDDHDMTRVVFGGDDPRTASGARASLITVLGRHLVDGLLRDAAADLDPKMARWRAQPADYLIDVLGFPRQSLYWSEHPAYATHVWDGTPDPLVAVCTALGAGDNVGVESGTGTGKTYLAAGLVCWFLDCYTGAQVVTAAPKEAQLRMHLWKELRTFVTRLKLRRPRALLTTLFLRMQPPGDAWSAIGFPVGVGRDETVATKAAGFHEPDMLIITEETPGMPDAVMAAFEQTSVAPHNLRAAFGNPDHQLDPLHRFCQSPRVTAIRISALDHPNVVADDPIIIPGAVSRQSIDDRREKYGDRSPLYLSRVRGIAPAEAANALVKLSWCYRARDRGRALADALGLDAIGELAGRPDITLPARLAGPDALGLDVANTKGGDLAAVARGRGAVCYAIDARAVGVPACHDANVLGAQIAAEYLGDGQGRVAADRAGVDGIGVGAGTVNELYRLGYPVRALIGNAAVDREAPGADDDTEAYANLRAQMHWRFMLDMQHDRIIIPDDEELINDLVVVTWEPRGGRIFIADKDKIKKDLPFGRSPNKGDAIIYWNWVRQVEAGATIGGASVTF